MQESIPREQPVSPVIWESCVGRLFYWSWELPSAFHSSRWFSEWEDKTWLAVLCGEGLALCIWTHILMSIGHFLLIGLVAPFWKDVSNELSCVSQHPNAENQMLAHLAKRKYIQLFWIFTIVALGLWPLAKLKSLFKKRVYVTAQLSVVYLVCLPVLSICIFCCLGSSSILNSELCGHLYRLETVSVADA